MTAHITLSQAESHQPRPDDTGRLFLVSTGIGDPENITVRAQTIIAAADVVLGFQSQLEKFADLVRDKELHDPGHGLFTTWGRQDREESETQAMEERIRAIVRPAVAAGKTVVVMDYGDSMIFGPHSGYMEEFADLAPVVVPGVSSFNAANAALTRDIMTGRTSRSAILTAARNIHDEYTGSDRLELLTRTHSTLVFFTMRTELADLVARLRTLLPDETPIAIVYHAGWASDEAVLRATLGTVLDELAEGKQPFEHLVYVGDFLA